MKRRNFIHAVSGAFGAGLMDMEGLFANLSQSDRIVKRVAGLPRRKLGKTKQEISMIGFPGLALSHETQESSNTAVRWAFEHGVNYFDVAPAYGKDGECEIKLGTALRQLKRKKVFLACKTKARDREGARLELERSLQRLQTDHFDLYQLHHLVTVEEVNKALGPGGAMETILEARHQGKVKWIGFSAHTTKAAVTALKAFPFDTIMFPLFFSEYYLRDYGREVIETAAERGTAVFAMKALSMGAWAKEEKRYRQWWYKTAETPEEVALSLRFSLSLKGVTAGIPPSFVQLLQRAVQAAGQYRPITPAEKDQLQALAQKCSAQFIREDQKAEGLAVHIHPPSDMHPYGDV